jgi:hypothetical protein
MRRNAYKAILGGTVAIVALYASHFSAQAAGVGDEFQVNETTVDQQMHSSVTDYARGFVVTWQSGFHPGGQYDVYARLYSTAGSPRGSEFKVNKFSAGHQNHPTAARLSNGGFVICWQSFEQDGSGYGIYCQVYNESGTPEGQNFRANSFTTMNQQEASVSGLRDGGFVVVWKDEGRSGRIVGRIFTNEGAKVRLFIADRTTGFGKASPSVAALADGGFVVVWQSFEQEGSGLGWGIYGQRFAADGAKVGKEIHVNTTTDNEQISPVVTGLNNGNFVVAWQGRDSSGTGVKAQIFRANGKNFGIEFLVNTTEESHQLQPAITSLKNGGFVILWHAWTGVGPTPAFNDVNGQAYKASGTPDGDEFRVNTHSPEADAGNQDNPAVARLGGGFIATWTSTGQDGDKEGIFGQRFSAP